MTCCLGFILSLILNKLIQIVIVLCSEFFLDIKMPKILESEKIYHGCFTKNRDGTNKLITKGEKCLIPTNKPFWKYFEDVPDEVKTRKQ